MATQEHGKLAAAFDPRVKMYRDPFNEQLVFTLSAAGASFGVPLMLLVVGVIFGKFSAVVFVLASVLLEWFHIFVVGRPQMKPQEAVAWAALWGTAAAFFGVCFYYWVFLGAV
jgi:hypothetical protein